MYRGLKPVNWCFDCGSALAEAEVEYKDRTDPTIDVMFAFAEPEKTAQAFGLPALPRAEGGIVIWTTTPWTIPANQALNLHPEIVYALVDTERGLLIIAEERVEACMTDFKLTGRVVATAPGVKLAGLRFHHPLASAHPGYKRTAPVYLGDYVTTDTGTGVVHSSPAYGIEDFQSCKAHGMTDSDIINPVMGDGRYIESLPLFGGLSIWDANPKVVDALNAAGSLLRSEHWQLHALLAPQDGDHLPRDVAVVRRHGRDAARRGERCAKPRWKASTRPRSTVVGQAAPVQHDREPS